MLHPTTCGLKGKQNAKCRLMIRLLSLVEMFWQVSVNFIHKQSRILVELMISLQLLFLLRSPVRHLQPTVARPSP
jgi:hypothetical protein